MLAAVLVPHPAVAIIAACLLLILIVAVIWTLFQSEEIRVWTGGAWAAFVNGFIEGSPVGGPAGAGIAAADGQVHADLTLRHLAIEAAHVLAVPFFTGLADVRSFNKANPFPNPLVQKTNKLPPTP